ncbi:MAG TPA: cytochrome P450 [Thermomicrobiales bacterium]|nr:cytochrome P450 [Thermomicrobiales bacterium]
MPAIPEASGLDQTLPFIRDPYFYISTTAARLGTDAFQVRLLGRPSVCLTGPEAARFHSDTTKFFREGAMPRVVATPLLGQGGVQGLDDEAHRHRKAMLMSLVPRDSVETIAERTRAAWRMRAAGWPGRNRVTLYDEAKWVITRAVCDWAGVPLAEDEVSTRADQMSARYEGAGVVGLPHLRARRMKAVTEQWIMEHIEAVRSGRLEVPEQTALHTLAMHRQLDGTLLDARPAATDLLSVLRPTVAVSVWVMFAAHALHHHPAVRARLLAGDEQDLERFVQEVRRVYPFFPVTAARARDDLEWNGVPIRKGQRVILDLYGTNHHAGTWPNPDTFDPERFRSWDGDPNTFIPQGAGDAWVGHRCAGEGITVALTAVSTDFLLRKVRYDVPPQDLAVDYRRLPGMIRSRMVVTNARPADVVPA